MPDGPGADEGAVPRNVQLSKYPAEPRTWCLTASQPLFLRRGAPRPAPHFPDRPRGRGASLPASPYFLRRQAPRPPLQNADRPRGRGASLPYSPYFFVGKHHVLRSKVPGIPGGVVPHSPLSLVPSSAGTTSGDSNTSVGTACDRMLQNLDFSR